MSGALALAVLSYVLSRPLPGWLTASFVDVVRYIDTSPRSYGVRRDIRKGLIVMLQALHAHDRRGNQRSDRVIVVAHTPGSFIAYDATAYLWGPTYARTSKDGDADLAGLTPVEELGDRLNSGGEDAAAYQAAQTALFQGLRATGNPWLISDFISVGAPMYFADRLMPGKRALGFAQRKVRHELPTCPPLTEVEDVSTADRLRLEIGPRIPHAATVPTIASWRPPSGRGGDG